MTFTRGLLIAAASALALASAGQANAQAGQGEDRPWQFRSAQEQSALNQTLVIMEQKKGGLFEKSFSLGGGGVGGGTAGGASGMGTGAQATSNFFQFIDQRSIDCSGTNVTCTVDGSNAVTAPQTTTSSPVTATNTLEGNTVEQRDNTFTNTTTNTVQNQAPGTPG